MPLRLPRPRHHVVVAYLALLLALGGTAYAAGLPKNSVGSAQIRNGSITKVDLRKGVLPHAVYGTSQIAGSTPPSGLSTTGEFPVRLPAAGPTLLTFFVPLAGITCTTGTAVAGLYVDGKPVPGSGSSVNGSSNEGPLSLAGVARLKKGQHVARLAYGCSDGSMNFTAALTGEFTWTGVLLGSGRS